MSVKTPIHDMKLPGFVPIMGVS